MKKTDDSNNSDHSTAESGQTDSTASSTQQSYSVIDSGSETARETAKGVIAPMTLLGPKLLYANFRA